ncbi:MAG: hypothetical protein EBZ77_16075, partial [Chitinophagia bacterium]|nr:hypothetical protein [Chitinophagia bacterium]
MLYLVVMYLHHKQRIEQAGFSVITDVYSEDEVQAIISLIEAADSIRPTFRRSAGLFAIRQFLKEVPETLPLIFSAKMKALLEGVAGSDLFVVKSIYFDKPPGSNWFVAYHQDLTISVVKRAEVAGYGPWTVKENQYAVQPPLHILQHNTTICGTSLLTIPRIAARVPASATIRHSNGRRRMPERCGNPRFIAPVCNA